ncbi:MAG: hypothetical protein ACOX5G_10425 [Kiritimatiellia bacterium]|jgi:hypothetical protein
MTRTLRVHPDITLHWEAGNSLALLGGTTVYTDKIEIDAGEVDWPLDYAVIPRHSAISFAIAAEGQAAEGGKAVDIVHGRVVDVDLDVDANHDGKIDDADEPLEMDPGGYVGVCTNHLTPVTLKLEPAGLPGKLTLSATMGGDRIRIWKDAGRAVEVVLTNGCAQVAPGTLYVEGVTNSAALRDVELRLEYDENLPGQDNPLFKCEDRVRLTVLSVDIVDPEEDDVHLVGEEVKFDGELEPTGLSGVTYAWSVLEVTCDPTTATTEDFETTLKSEGSIKVKLEVTIGGTTCEKIRTIEAVLPEVTKLSWNNDHAMTKWGGGAITDPVWVKTLGGAVTKNEPGTYTKDGEATAELEIEGDSPLTHPTSVQIKGDGNTENFYPDGATFHNWTWSSGELQLDSSPLCASVNFYDTLDVTWYYRVEKLAGGWGDWVEMNESTHLLYTVDATPAASPLYDRGVDKGCRYANGASDFAGAINTGLADDLLYEPTGCTSHDLGIFDIGSGQCCCHASVFSVLISHVTSSSPATEDCWGGCSSSTHCHFKYSGWWGPTFQCQRPVEDSVDANPHFNFHVEVPYNGTVYDPSYGLTGWATLLETAPAIPNAHPNAAVFQSGSWPPATAHAVDWTCPH